MDIVRLCKMVKSEFSEINELGSAVVVHRRNGASGTGSCSRAVSKVPLAGRIFRGGPRASGPRAVAAGASEGLVCLRLVRSRFVALPGLLPPAALGPRPGSLTTW